jgi:hypothetical protein
MLVDFHGISQPPSRKLAWQARAARILREAPKASHGFDRTAFANDPRIKAMKWER